MKKSEKDEEHITKLSETNKLLVENFTGLQKAITNLAVKFDSLSDNISKLLNLFEISARSFAEKLAENPLPDLEKDKEFLDKMNKLLDQNKVIAKGLTLMEEKLRERVYGYHPQESNIAQQPARKFIPANFSGQQIKEAITPKVNEVKPNISGEYLPSQFNQEKKENAKQQIA